jgi:ribonuclease-3
MEKNDLLQQVFVHRSYINEHKDFKLDHNERLEFLGDAVLELVVTEYLYLKYSDPEGVLTNWRSALVKGDSLSNLASKLNMQDYLLLSKGESKSEGKGRKIILANSFEALLGAIYLDKGYDIVKKFICKKLVINLPEIIENQLYIDSKSKLQEVIQEKISITPKYNLLKEYGPDHSKKFVMGVYIDDKLIGQGEGNSKQDAEQKAALDAINNYIVTL